MNSSLPFILKLLGTAVGCLLPWFFLHAWCVWPLNYEGVSVVEALLKISPDFLLVAGAAAVLSTRRGLSLSWALSLSLLLLFVRLYRFGWATIPAFYGKPFDLYNDVLMLPSLYHLLTHERPASEVTLILVGLGVGLLLIVALLVWSLKGVVSPRRHGSRNTRRFAALVIVGLLWMLSLCDGHFGRREASSISHRGMVAESVCEVAKIVRTDMWRWREAWKQRSDQAFRRLSGIPTSLTKLKGVDVYLMWIESYGRQLYENPESRARWEECSKGWTERLLSQGFYGGTRYAYPSIAGGMSSLAHMELLCGVQVPNRRVFDVTLGSWLKPLPKFLRDQGYRTVNVQSAMTVDWPKGRSFYGFDRDLFFNDMNYSGPIYHWGKAPDHYSLGLAFQQEVRSEARTEHPDRPLFLQFVSVIGHSPWALVPPIVPIAEATSKETLSLPPAKDWGLTWSNWVNHPQLWPAYTESMRYSMETMVGFMEALERPSLVIVLGDHQPPGLKRIDFNDPREREVPMHLFSNRLDLLGHFESLGFQLGWFPNAELKPYSFSDFLYHFLNALK